MLPSAGQPEAGKQDTVTSFRRVIKAIPAGSREFQKKAVGLVNCSLLVAGKPYNRFTLPDLCVESDLPPGTTSTRTATLKAPSPKSCLGWHLLLSKCSCP